MGKNNSFMEYLRSTGHFVASEADLPRTKTFYKTEFTPQKMAALILHSILSSKPRKNYYTDGNYIYYSRGDEINFHETTPTDTQGEDVIREDEILKILKAHPRDYRFLYGKKGDHIRISDFSYAFNGRGKKNSLYDKFLESIVSKLPSDLIRKDEKNRIKSRISCNEDNLSSLISSLESDNHNELVGNLKRELAKYDTKYSA